MSTSFDAHEIGKLCVGGDWACAHGDFGALRYIAQRLADHVPGPIHRELDDVASSCHCDPDRAAELWERARNRLHQLAVAR